ncbi:MAG: C10 family peptidase, partial [Bacteroidales bacterium]|nr:C10 family peptidase [Bacteroidales bacterium]
MSTDDAVAPLVTAQWGQGDPWNKYCPSDPAGRRALVGCVGVAMSQIMKYWSWPDKGSGTVSYLPPQHPEYGEVNVIFDTTHYHWDQMNAIHPVDASALILFHAGAASLMNYGPQLSATSVDRYALPALRNNFLYHEAMVVREMEQYFYLDWISMLKAELINQRPILYSGASPDGKVAHAFNIDGFRDQDYFHFNWGWNGAGDGWYNLSTMGNGSANFSAQQAAIFGLQPSNQPMHDRPSTFEVLPGDGFVQLFWQSPVITDFSHFTIYRDGQQIGLTANPNYRDENLENGKSYLYEVSANYGGQSVGESVHTPGITAQPWEALLPGYLQPFESGNQGWQLQNDESGFRIGQATDLGFSGNAGTIAAIRSEGLPAGVRAADYLTSPVLFPSSYKYLAVNFDYVYKQNPGNDLFFLMYRDFLTGIWQPITRLDSTGGWSDWKSFHIYLPKPASNAPIQIAFYYNDFYGDAFGAAVDNIRIYEVEEPAVPAFDTSILDLCQDQTVTFTDLSTGSIQVWDWDFGESAVPRYANTIGPHTVTYTSPGSKRVRLS